MKPSSSRAVFPVKRPTQKLRNTYSQSSLHTRAKHWIRRDSAQKLCAPDRILYCAEHRRQRHRNRDDVHTFSTQQRQRQHHRHLHRNNRKIITPHQRFRRRKMYRTRICNPCANARKIFAPVQNHAHHKAHQRPRRRNRGGVHLYGKQRNPTQKKRLRRIFIQSHQKFVLRKIFPSVNRRASVKRQRSRSCVTRCRLSRRQRKHRTFGISSRLVHGRRATLSLLTVR